MKKFIAFLALCLVFVTIKQPAEAAFSNYNSILIGDLAAGMGGAATALVGDTSSSAFYNPATLSRLDGSSFSAAVGIYKKFDTTYGETEDFTRAPLRVNQGFFRSLPASTGNMIRIDDWAIGLTIVVPDYDSFKGDLQSTSTNTSTLSFIDESLWVGGAVAKDIDQDTSVGLSIYYTARNSSKSVSDRSYPSANEAKLFSSERTITENAILAILGYYHKIDDQWAFGISLRPPSLRVASSATYFENYTEYIGGTFKNETPTSLTNLSTSPHVPAKLAIGLYHQPHPRIRLTTDLTLYEGFSYADINQEEIKIEYSHRPIINAALGGELTLIEWLKFRAGVFTNFSAHPEPNSEIQKSQPDRVDQLGFSANAVFYAGKTMSYTFGGYYSGGVGKSMQRIDQKYSFITKNQHVFTMLVGSSFYF